MIKAIAGLVALAIGGWVVMLTLDVVHEDAPGVPALGYWASIAVCVLVNIIGVMWRFDERASEL